MSAIELTDTQAEALRILVGCPDGLRLGKGTDANVGTINSRVANTLADHGLAEVRGYDTFGEPSDPFAVPTLQGHGWVRDDGAARIEQAVQEAAPDVDVTVTVDGEVVEEADDTVSGDGSGEALPPIDDEGGDEERFDGRVIDGWTTKVTGGVYHHDSRHLGDRIVLLVEGHISNVSGKLGEDGLVREQTVKVSGLSTLPSDVEQPLNRYIAAIRTSGEDSLFDDSDTAREDLVDRLNRDELEVRDDDGKREWNAEEDEGEADPGDQPEASEGPYDPVVDALMQAEQDHPTADELLATIVQAGEEGVDDPETDVSEKLLIAGWVSVHDGDSLVATQTGRDHLTVITDQDDKT